MAQIARILIFFSISKESSFSLTETFLGIKNFILSENKLKNEDFFASKRREENLGVIEKRFKLRQKWYQGTPLFPQIPNIPISCHTVLCGRLGSARKWGGCCSFSSVGCTAGGTSPCCNKRHDRLLFNHPHVPGSFLGEGMLVLIMYASLITDAVTIRRSRSSTCDEMAVITPGSLVVAKYCVCVLLTFLPTSLVERLFLIVL